MASTPSRCQRAAAWPEQSNGCRLALALGYAHASGAVIGDWLRAAAPREPAGRGGRIRGGAAASGARDPRPPRGARRRGPLERSAPGPTADLVRAGLLARLDDAPRDGAVVGATCPARRGGRQLDQPPSLATSERGQSMVDRAAAGAAFELVRRMELLLDRWGTHPPPALKGGGLGVRELRGQPPLLHVEPEVAALVIESASAAGLLDQGIERRPRLRLAAHRRVRRLAGRPDLGALGPPSRGPGWATRGCLSCRWPHRRQAGERVLT